MSTTLPAPILRNGFDVLSLVPIMVEFGRRAPRGALALSIGGKTGVPILSAAARRKFPTEATVEYLGSPKHPDVLAIRPAPKGTKYAAALAKSGNLPKQIGTMLAERGWPAGRHPAEWRDGCLVIWRADAKKEG